MEALSNASGSRSQGSSPRRILQEASATGLQTKTVRPMRQYLGHLSKLQITKNPVLNGLLQPPKHLLEEQTIANISSIKFRKCVETCFLTLTVPARKEALLDLLHSNQENLLSFISWLAIALAAVITILWSLRSC